MLNNGLSSTLFLFFCGLSHINFQQLHKADIAWKPKNYACKHGTEAEDPEQVKTEDLFKQVRGILNKITPERFEGLMKKLMGLPIDTEDRLRGVTGLIFNKAISEPNFSVIYAKMCHCLMEVCLVSECCLFAPMMTSVLCHVFGPMNVHDALRIRWSTFKITFHFKFLPYFYATFVRDTEKAHLFKKNVCNVFLPQMRVSTPGMTGGFVDFHKVLLNLCQTEFHKNHAVDGIIEKKKEELKAAKDVRNHLMLRPPTIATFARQNQLFYHALSLNIHLCLPTGSGA